MRLAALLASLAASATLAAPDLSRVEREVARQTNAFRVQQGLAPLDADPALDAAARAFAGYMARTDRYGHTADGRQPGDRAREAGYDACLTAENISYQFTTGSFGTEELARRFVEGWKASPGHRRNMVEPHAQHGAAAVARSARTGRYYGVQMFGRPRERSIEFRVANTATETVRYEVDTKEFSLRVGQERVHTTCTPPVVTFAAADAGSKTFRPTGGERLRVEGGRRPVIRSER